MTLEEFRIYLADRDAHFLLYDSRSYTIMVKELYQNIRLALQHNNDIWIWTTAPTAFMRMRGTEIMSHQKYPASLFDKGKQYIKGTKRVLERDEIIRKYIEVVTDTPDRMECRICYEKFDPPAPIQSVERWQRMTLAKFEVYLENCGENQGPYGSPDFDEWTRQTYENIRTIFLNVSNVWIWTANPTTYTEKVETGIVAEQQYAETSIGKIYINALKKVLERDEILSKYVEVLVDTPEHIECRLCYENFAPTPAELAENWQKMTLGDFDEYLYFRSKNRGPYNSPDFDEWARQTYVSIAHASDNDSTIWIWTVNPTTYTEMRGAEVITHQQYSEADLGKIYIDALKKILERDTVLRNFIEVLVDTPDRLECRICYEKFNKRASA
jgi:hypothetical protein